MRWTWNSAWDSFLVFSVPFNLYLRPFWLSNTRTSYKIKTDHNPLVKEGFKSGAIIYSQASMVSAILTMFTGYFWWCILGTIRLNFWIFLLISLALFSMLKTFSSHSFFFFSESGADPRLCLLQRKNISQIKMVMDGQWIYWKQNYAWIFPDLFSAPPSHVESPSEAPPTAPWSRLTKGLCKLLE